jgi:lysophospholipase L1-like esterase
MRLLGPSAARLIRRGLVVRPTLVVLVRSSLVLGLVTTIPARAERAIPAPPVVLVPVRDPNIRYLGRWGRTATSMTTVNSGSRVVLRFTGRHVAATFDQSTVTHPPQIYVRIDDGVPARYTVDRNLLDLTPRPLPGERAHTLEIDVKDLDERANRWVPPLQSGLILTGFRLDNGARTLSPPAISSRRIEFLGDSITQGVRALGPEIGVNGSDATKDYAWLVGKAFRANFRQVGFGAQGILKMGNGQVPPAGAALGLNFAGSPIDPSFVPQVAVVNQGTNDALTGVNPAQFQPAYLTYLRQIRTAWPSAWIFALRPFGGYMARQVAAAVATAADPRIVYVDTSGWLTATGYTDGLHPTYTGHLQVARRLSALIAARTGWSYTHIKGPQVELRAAGAAPGFESGGAPGWVPGAYVSSVTIGAGNGVSATKPYDGKAALQATSTVAPLGEWRTMSLRPGTDLRVPASARDLFVYVSPIIASNALYDLRLTVSQGRDTQTVTVYSLPHLAALIPWNRVHANLTSDGPITGLSVSVRTEGTSASGRLSFQLDDVGWTDRSDG